MNGTLTSAIACSDRVEIPNIVAKFLHRTVKNALISACRTKKPTLQKIGANSSERFYITEHLSPRNAALYYEARCIKRKHEVQYLWTKDGKIKARRR